MDMHYPYQLPPLPYAYEALSPNISGDTLHFHHDKHFQTYVDNLNTALADCPECQSKPLDELLKNLDRLPDPKRTAIRNNGGGVYNHLLYFDGMCACHSSRPSGGLAMAMERDFGSFEGWKEQMKAAALGQFGSGYAWLVSETSGKLSVMKLPNQDCPLSMGLWRCSVWTCGSMPTIWTTRTAGPNMWTAGLSGSTGPSPKSGMRGAGNKQGAPPYWTALLVYVRIRRVSTCLQGRNSTSAMAKFPAQWSRSKGMPLTHQDRAKAHPPVTQYTRAHSAPKLSPKAPESTAQPRGDSIFRNSIANTTSTSHT